MKLTFVVAALIGYSVQLKWDQVSIKSELRG